MPKQNLPDLASEIDGELVAAAKKRNPGVNPQSMTLTTRERIVIAAMERRMIVLASRFTDREVKRLQGVIHRDDGA